ncbi:aldehyde dehydrogenase family protein [Actinomycetospora endophytica]|uniref:Aldehyde dehydrogenase n=1 Tax=Actinomycetospora endophytica TaxID=2291215 RepID=A0ABS8PFC3_9PSEU|nr:aldehyde dehydrogenase family protein [Actinomycetospora endophytica]MCD2196960.1 aldehyde dehydrogenase family protein [Actinomycetospora endophytica]
MTSTAPKPASTGPAAGSDTFDSLDPRDGSVVATHPRHTPAQVKAVVAQARAAADWWADLGFDGRRSRLAAWRRLLISRTDELAALVSHETGKPLDDARIEVVLVIDHLHWAGKHAKAALGRRRAEAGALMVNHTATIEYRPLGVVGVLGPWNYPVFTPMGSIVYALAAGNAIVFKPSELTPTVGRWLVDTFAEVLRGTDPGRDDAGHVFGLVTGEGETGAALCRAGVDKVAFTGSTATAKKVMATCAESLTPVLVECGGKDALLVDHDADLDDAAAAAVWGAMSNAGQTCVGVERVYVVESVAEVFLDKVAQRAATVRPGGEPRSIYGPITMPSQLGIISDQIDDALSRGGRAVVGGRESVHAPYVDPVVLADVPEDSIAVTDETFGPTVVVNRVRDIDEAVERANASRYGLGGSVFAKKRGYEIARRLRCGMVSVNGVIAFAAMPSLPFGGVGDSGFGRIHGRDGLREFTRPLAVSERRFKSINVMTFDRPGWVVKAMTVLAGLIYRRNR